MSADSQASLHASSLPPSNVSSHPKRGWVRWSICGLLFFATTVNYMDRQVIAILKPVLEKEMHWSESDYGWIVFWFQFAYAVMMPIVGRIIDSVGTRAGYALGVILWSLASMSHSLAHSWRQFAIARFALGLGESFNFPAAIKTVADWFPQQERSLATGIFNSGSNLGAILAPLLVPVVAQRLGWRSAFLATGALDLIWLAAWLAYYRSPQEHRRIQAPELQFIEAGRSQEVSTRIPYSRLLTKRAAWAFAAGKFLTDPVWWFYLFWLPGFLHSAYGLNLTQLGPPLIAVYVSADAGSVAGGWLSKRLAAVGWSMNRARKGALLICALGTAPMMAMPAVRSLWPAVALISLAAAAHQGWSANLFTVVSDTMPRRAVASVVGFGGFAGAVGGMLAARGVGYWLDVSHKAYVPLFMVAGGAYLTALLVIQLLAPDLKPEEI
jgi:ACS family hexuronate transporter-like MFS transporter